jgi:hypothetical protein
VLAPRREAGFDDLVVGSACVKRFLSDDGEQWMMWYSGRGKDFDKEVMQLTTGQIGLATSTNGIDWKREGAVFTENKDEVGRPLRSRRGARCNLLTASDARRRPLLPSRRPLLPSRMRRCVFCPCSGTILTPHTSVSATSR